VIHTPGHTPGEVVFHLPARKVLISGDTLVTQNLMTGKHGGPQLPHRLLNGNDGQSRRSLERLKELGSLTMLPGHGRHWNGSMTEAVEIARHHQALQ
jgi:glyoxylase-like metal-dependent hydrolase (beta-lactamase superfamily II)